MLDNRFFAYNGELVQGHGLLVELPNNVFNLVTATVVPTVVAIRTHLAAHSQGDQLFDPLAAGDPDTVLSRSRASMLLPNKYAGHFLSQPNGFMPRYYFETILPAIKADGMAAKCEPLTHFCQLAVTCSQVDGQPMVQIGAPTPTPRHVGLFSHAHTLLTYHLPSLGVPQGALGVILQPLVATLLASQQQHQDVKALAQLEKLQKESATVKSWLGWENLARLLRYAQVETKEQLPPIWKALAKTPSCDRLSILQGKVHAELIALGAVFEQFTVSLALLTEIATIGCSLHANALMESSATMADPLPDTAASTSAMSSVTAPAVAASAVAPHAAHSTGS